MPGTAKDIIDTHLANSGPDPNARSPTPEPTTQSGVKPGHALYDSPDEGSQPAEFCTGRRQRRSTERGGSWIEDRRRSEDIRKKGNRTRKINSARRAHERTPALHNNSSHVQSHSQSNPVPPSHTEFEPKPLPTRRQHGMSSKARYISRSPTPASTDHEPEEATQPPTTESQYTFVYKTLDHEGLVEYARKNHGVDGRNCNTQTILTKIRVAQKQQAPQVGSPRQPPSIKALPGRPLQVGGGWHLEYPASYQSESQGSKREASMPPLSGSSKRLRLATDEWDNTATEPKTDEDPIEYRMRNAVKNIMGPYPSKSDNRRPNPPQPSLLGTHARLPSQDYALPLRESTQTTVAASQPSRSLIGMPSRSHYGKSTTPTSPIPQIPNLLLPLRGSTHARVRGELLQCHLDHMDPNNKAADAQAGQAGATDKEIDQLSLTDDEAIPKTDPNTRPGPQRTYNRTRSHLPCQPQTNPPKPDDATRPVPHPNSTGLDRSQLVRAKRTQAVVTKTLASRLIGKSTVPPLSRSQPRRSPGASGDARPTHTKVSRRLDPGSSARSDMVAFNEAVAQGKATLFVQSATRQSERMARCAAPPSRPLHELLDDNEELLAQAEALAKKKWPGSSTQSRGRNQKQKPLARDVSGLLRQILILAKIHLLAYALVQGVYQTRATYLRWAESVHFATWNMELPTMPFEGPQHEHFEIMVNSIATLRGKVKERLHPFTAITAGFQHCTTNQEVIQENLRKFNLIYPNTFHCKSYLPRKGHYENPEVAHCIAAALFHGPGSVGVMFPDYFVDMPLTVVAFTLAIWQFCIEEWSTGKQQNGDLGMAAMRERYEAQLAGLKELRDIAPKRMKKLQTEWHEYVMEYSGAMLRDTEHVSSEAARQSEIRLDTPELGADNEAWTEAQALAEAQIRASDAISVEEMNARLAETGRQASLQERAQEIAAREELENDMDIPIDEEDEDEEAPAPILLFAGYNMEGCPTTGLKGKHRAN